jgi:hypothetical protein
VLDPIGLLGRALACETRVLSYAYHRVSRGIPLSELIFVGCFSVCFKTWLTDNSPDCEQTMAALDRALDRYENICRDYF